MKNNTLPQFFEVLLSKVMNCFLTKNIDSTLTLFKFKDTFCSDSLDKLLKIKNDLGSLLSFRSLLLLVSLSFVGLSTAVAQTTTTFPSSDRCTSKDLELVSATLTGGEACTSCLPGDDLTRTLTLGINNKTGSSRTAFAFWGTLEITSSTGIVTTTTISRCSDTSPIPPTGPLPAVYTGGDFGTITYKCGDALKLTNLYLAWTDASPKSTCESIKSSNINPKCGTLPFIEINAGVNGTITSASATCTAEGSITVAPFGGVPPYTVKLGNGDSFPVLAGGSHTFNNLAANTYNITITDSTLPNNCSVTKAKIVEGPTPISKPEASVVQPTCSVGTGTITVTSPVTGVTYTLKQLNVLKYTAVSGVFSLVVPGTYDFAAAIGTCTTSGDPITVNQQPATPLAPSLKIIQPTASLCGATSTGSIEVCNPIVGYTYKLYLGSATSPSVSTTYASGSLVFNNLVAGSNPSVTATTSANCTSALAACSSATATCPAPAAKIAETSALKETVINDETLKAGFEAYPVPFKDVITIRYNFDYVSEVKIEVFNPQGIRVLSKTDTNVYLGKEIALDLKMNSGRQQVYIVKLTTNQGSSTKKVISSQ